MSSLFRRKLDELEDMFIASQDDLLARFSATYEENKRLKAEVERLTAFTTRTIIPNEELQAQVERLTKAGDAFVLLLEDEGYDIESIREVDCWNAAKEGKPRA